MTIQAVNRINSLISRYPDARYLEIGVCRGETFRAINAASKVAVDPRFLFEVPPPEEGISYHQTTSDDYFRTIAKDSVFDVVFLDGLHVFEQTFRDFCNAVCHTHEHSIIIIDDTIPSDPYSALRDQKEAVRQRRAHGSKSRAWHGDTFKTIIAIHEFFPAYSYATVMDDGNPQTVVWRQPRRLKPVFPRVEDIGRMDYFDFRNHVDLFNPVSSAEFQGLIGQIALPG